jgi:hypothetical protein
MSAARQLRLAACTGADWNYRPPPSNPGEGADRPPARNSRPRTPQVARSAVPRSELFSDNFSRNLAVQKPYGLLVRRNAYRYTFGVWPTVKNTDRLRV